MTSRSKCVKPTDVLCIKGMANNRLKVRVLSHIVSLLTLGSLDVSTLPVLPGNGLYTKQNQSDKPNRDETKG